MEVVSLKNSIYQMVLDGDVSENFLKKLINVDGSVVPIECSLWDYKASFNSTDIGQRKALKAIVSFYNTYGGYLIYGIDEVEKDTSFKAVGIEPNQINLQKLSGQFDKYFGQRIELLYSEIEMLIQGEKKLFGVLFIPKRNTDAPSLAPISSANDDKNKPLLQKNAVYFRTADECRQVTSIEDFEFISSPRNYNGIFSTTQKRKKIIEHNLPDKNFICPVFIGRFPILEELWAWLADEFQYTKVLAADGGKGKTSIAYEFCQLLIRTKVEGLEQVIWLTAKKKQFKAMFDEYIDTPETHYSDLHTLLEQVCIKTGSLESEILDYSTTQLMRVAKNNLIDYPSFIVIDDVDSNAPDEQKRILEAARIFSNPASRVLVTTRVNSIYSVDSSISIPGMSGSEYQELVNTICTRFKLPSLNENNLLKLENISEGSPLFTESILRLLKRGSSVENSLNEWNKKSGLAVREAALRKEVDELSLSARKILITVSSVGSCSKAELHQLTDMENAEIENALVELDQLFLVSSIPFIEEEPRYESSTSIANLTLSISDELLPDARKFRENIRKVFNGLQANLKSHIPRVAQAIGQCNALIKSERFGDARKTLKALISEPEYKENKDLHFMAAKIEYYDSANDTLEDTLFQTAYIKGQRKMPFFEMWFEYASLQESNSTPLDICRKAIQTSGIHTARWCDRFVEYSDKQVVNVINPSRKLELLIETYNIYVQSKATRPSNSNWALFRSKCQELLENICNTCDHIPKLETKAKVILQALKHGDLSSYTCNQLVTTSGQIRKLKPCQIEKYDTLSENIFNAITVTIDCLKSQETIREQLIKALQAEQLAHAIPNKEVEAN
ncbi:ATP-binding protein [Shewanella sp. N2AIL]|uniref:AlbA family DNA-binding domain-containing protein n=1 Tax=Shewanella sp. N2AIL TaxID=2926851 RepID=UPI001F564179|nr:ATP-binding protein [Shewanella sp. N2AIL]MCI2962535.1 ATP-binding protein [Shewanella sp. N2AIL]